VVVNKGGQRSEGGRGGQGFPLSTHSQVTEYLISANSAIKIYPGLAVCAGHLIDDFGTAGDHALFCEKMDIGVWGETRCPTEPDTGSDVGFLKTRAVPDPADSDPRVYQVEGPSVSSATGSTI
jgi:alkylation response protein AidB-like acyl-CoA dehydrogenase